MEAGTRGSWSCCVYRQEADRWRLVLSPPSPFLQPKPLAHRTALCVLRWVFPPWLIKAFLKLPHKHIQVFFSHVSLGLISWQYDLSQAGYNNHFTMIPLSKCLIIYLIYLQFSFLNYPYVKLLNNTDLEVGDDGWSALMGFCTNHKPKEHFDRSFKPYFQSCDPAGTFHWIRLLSPGTDYCEWIYSWGT